MWLCTGIYQSEKLKLVTWLILLTKFQHGVKFYSKMFYTMSDSAKKIAANFFFKTSFSAPKWSETKRSLHPSDRWKAEEENLRSSWDRLKAIPGFGGGCLRFIKSERRRESPGEDEDEDEQQRRPQLQKEATKYSTRAKKVGKKVFRCWFTFNATKSVLKMKPFFQPFQLILLEV